MYDTILVPTDGSTASDRALDEAIGIAKLHGAALHVLSVVDDNVLPLDGYSQQVFESLRTDAKQSVAEAVKHAQERGWTRPSAKFTGERRSS